VAAAHGVVIVDPWPLVRLGIGRALPGLSYRVVAESAGAADAPADIARTSPSLVVLGANVGDDGPPVVEAAKARGAFALAIVGRARRDELVALAGAGADGIITAGVEPAELASAADRVLAGERVLAPSLLPALVGAVGPPTERPGDRELLTDRERQVLSCLVRGARNDQIASQLFMSPSTVKTHLNHIYAKLGVNGRHEALARAVELGLTV